MSGTISHVSHRTLLFSVISALVLALWSGCGASRSSGLCETINLSEGEGDLAAAEAGADAAWLQRADEAQLTTAIAQWREAVRIAPEKTENYVKLAKALYLWGDGFLRFQEKDEEMLKAFEEATFFAERALKIQNPEFQMSVCSQEPFEKSVRLIRRQDIPAVYWYSVALGKYGLAKSIVIVLDNKDRIFAMMQHIRRLAPDYNHGASDRYLGAYFTKIPFPRGDLARSRQHFERSIRRAPNYMATRVLMAQMLAPKLGDRELFRTQLEHVINASDDVLPGMEPETAIEKRRARLLLDDIDTIFVPEEEGE